MKIPFFVQEFTAEMEEAAIHALRNESFVGGESVSKFEEEFETLSPPTNDSFRNA